MAGAAIIPIIDLHRATLYRDDTSVLSDFSFSLRDGERAAIVGANEAGKLALLELFSGEVHPMTRDETCVALARANGWYQALLG
ncbi:MAG: ATP-binding cassette domain-containing protein [Nitrospiraceae bacterium]